MAFRDVRNERGHLLFRYDPERDLIEVKSEQTRGNREVVDLREHRREDRPRGRKVDERRGGVEE